MQPASDTPTRSVDRLVPERAGPSPATEVSKRPTPFQRIANLWRYRELIGNLTRKELKVKYKNSVLGFVWSLLNPLMYLVVFSLVFDIIAQVSVPYFGIFFLAGLLAWNLFSTGLSGGTSAIVANAQLVTKVWFPREALVLASIFAAIVHFVLQSLVLIGAMLVFRRMPDITYVPVMLLAVVVTLLLCTALAIALSAVNVYLRDTEHLLEVALLAWFWMSAIAINYGTIAHELVARYGANGERLAALNPMLTVVVAFQRTLYNPAPLTPAQRADPNFIPILPEHPMGWYLTHLAWTGVVALVLLYGALWLFSRLEDNFAQEI
ncbi:MAG: ABC transporter permease [Acidimicrobiales bacterium]|nr:ABC transporter permease [Acidimicrobiales bacterium]